MDSKIGFKKAVFENGVKNGTIVLILWRCYNHLFQALNTVDSQNINNVLLIISIFLMIVCFVNFTFTYNRRWLTQLSFRILSHLISALFLLLIGFLLEAMMIAVSIVYPGLSMITSVFVILLFLGLVVFDFWDFLRNCIKENNII